MSADIQSLSLEARLEAMIFASRGPIKLGELHTHLKNMGENFSQSEIHEAVHLLMSDYRAKKGGFQLVDLGQAGYQFQTPQCLGPLMEEMFQTRPRPLSRAALETLAIIAYRQPTTRAEVEKIRGVESGAIIKSLLDRQILRCAGRKEDLGRPMLFATDQEFLRIFSLKDLGELPPLSAFQPEPELMKEAFKKLNEDESELSAEDLGMPEENLGSPPEQEWVEADEGSPPAEV